MRGGINKPRTTNLFFEIVTIRISDDIENKQPVLPRLEHFVYGCCSLII
jgi:hypothetical protein